MTAHPDTWPMTTLTKKEFNDLPERRYPERGRACKRYSAESGWLRGTWLRQSYDEAAKTKTEHYLWERIWIASI